MVKKRRLYKYVTPASWSFFSRNFNRQFVSVIKSIEVYYLSEKIEYKYKNSILRELLEISDEE